MLLNIKDKNIPINFSYTSEHDTVKSVAENLWNIMHINKNYKTAAKKMCLVNLTINLKIVSQLNDYHLRYSRDSNYYKIIPARYKTDFQSYYIMIPIIDGLIENGYVKNATGYKTNSFGYQSCMTPTDKFISASSEITNDMFYLTEPFETIVLRDFDKNPVDYKENKKIKMWKSDAEKYNSLRKKAVVTLENVPYELKEKHEDFLINYGLNDDIRLRTTYVHRVFNRTFTKGGRFYGGIETIMPRELRRYICIDGQPTTEIDYSSLHIRMLYNMKGIDYRQNAYEEAADGNPQLYKVYKLFGLISINALDIKTCYRAFRQEIQVNCPGVLPDLKDSTIDKLYNKWKKVHKPIEEYFCSGIGLKLQNYDSNISNNLIKYFVRRDKMVLCVHDSYIINKKHENELADIMKHYYCREFKFKPIINIK